MFCGITAVLSAIAFIPGILVIAAFFVVVPMIVLGFAPDLLLVSVTLLIIDYLPFRSRPAKAAMTLAIAGLAFALVAASAFFNRPLEQKVRTLTHSDHDARAPLPETRSIAIRFVTDERARRSAHSRRPDVQQAPDVLQPPARKVYCEVLCLLLLYNHLVDSVLVSSTPQLDGDSTLDPADIGMRFHLEQERPCPKADLRTDDMQRSPYQLATPRAQDFARQVAARIAAGECVIAEPARLSGVPIVVEFNPRVLPLENESNFPAYRNLRQLMLAPQKASRTSIYLAQDGGGFAEVFRQTEVDAFPLVPVLLVGPVPTGEGGIGISEGFYRHRHVYSGYSLHDVLKAKLGLDVGLISQ